MPRPFGATGNDGEKNPPFRRGNILFLFVPHFAAAGLVLGKSPELGLNEKNFLPLQAAGAAPLEKNIKTGRPENRTHSRPEKRRLAMQGSYDAPAWTPQGLPRISRLP